MIGLRPRDWACRHIEDDAKLEEAIKLDIGGLCTQITSPHHEIIAHCADRYRDFLADRPPDLEIVLAFEAGIDLAEFLDAPYETFQPFTRRGLAKKKAHDAWTQPDPLLQSPQIPSSTVEERLESRPQISHLGQRTLFQRRDFAGWIDVEARRGRSVLRQNLEPFAVESFLRICYSFLAVEHGGVLLHSAGVIRDGNGYIFPGVSGTGKSTIASLATAREVVLSDEMVVVRKVGKSYLVYSTPFYGTNESANQNSNAPLKAAFLPVKDDQVYVKETKPAQALAKLLAGALFFGQEPSFNQRLMDISADIVARIPFYEMHFQRDTSFWKCIGELNGGQ
ncbi:MAG: hypothetical protein JW918_05335 [Anaerolineae bacterium]|nr:hypothetical protein [Anaerolineae bacterium]